MNLGARTFLFAFLTWLIPFGISMSLYDQETNSYLPNFPVFKTIMLLLLFGLTYFFYKRIKKDNTSRWTSIAILFTVVYSVFDVAMLIGVFKMDISMWLMAIFPFCIMSFFGIGYFVLRPRKNLQ